MRRGYFLPFGLTFAHPLAVFGILRQLAKVVTSGQRSARLRDIIADQHAEIGDILRQGSSEFDRGIEFEYLRVATRYAAMAIIARCLVGWPFMMVGYFGEAGMWRSWALRDRTPPQVPFELASAVDTYLTLG
jgi:hypothetical protein